MTMDFVSHVNRRKTPQAEPVLGREAEMEKNAAGGFIFKLDKWARLRRFLILGSEGGTYYIGEKELTKQNAAVVLECLEEDVDKTVIEIAFVSDHGLAPKNDSAIFALALCASAMGPAGPWTDARTRALAKLKVVCRTPTHLFQFVHYASALRGWGMGLRKAVADWYLSKDVAKLGYQMAKYQSRKIGGVTWTHTDLLLKAHVEPGKDVVRGALFRWANSGFAELDVSRTVTRRRHDGTLGEPKEYEAVWEKNLPDGILAMRELDAIANEHRGSKWNRDCSNRVIEAVEKYGLTHEMIPSEARNAPAVWESLLEKMPATALIRNLGTMTKVGVLEQLSDGTAKAVAKLSDDKWLRGSRIHPINVLVALKMYAQGHGMKTDRDGNFRSSWNPVPQIIDALDGAFYGSFDHVEPTGKKTVFALDVSGSMGSEVSGFPLSHSEVSACFSMVLMRTEPNWAVVGFNRGLVNLGITPKMRLDDVVSRVEGLTYEGTDCSIPARFAREKEIKDLESIVIITDGESWLGRSHPYQALEEYRRWSGVPTRQVVLSTTATATSISDPRDPLSLDISGFDLSVPQIVSGFLQGEM